jgi:hypothetical protein
LTEKVDICLGRYDPWGEPYDLAARVTIEFAVPQLAHDRSDIDVVAHPDHQASTAAIVIEWGNNPPA